MHFFKGSASWGVGGDRTSYDFELLWVSRLLWGVKWNNMWKVFENMKALYKFLVGYAISLILLAEYWYCQICFRVVNVNVVWRMANRGERVQPGRPDRMLLAAEIIGLWVNQQEGKDRTNNMEVGDLADH